LGAGLLKGRVLTLKHISKNEERPRWEGRGVASIDMLELKPKNSDGGPGKDRSLPGKTEKRFGCQMEKRRAGENAEFPKEEKWWVDNAERRPGPKKSWGAKISMVGERFLTRLTAEKGEFWKRAAMLNTKREKRKGNGWRVQHYREERETGGVVKNEKIGAVAKRNQKKIVKVEWGLIKGSLDGGGDRGKGKTKKGLL